MEGKCILCGKRNAETIHNGTRDNENIDVLKCKDCGLVFLDRWDDSIQQGGGIMRRRICMIMSQKKPLKNGLK